MIDTQIIIKFPIFITTTTMNKLPEYIVPIHRHTDTGISNYKVLIKASSRYEAMCIAINEFETDGWYIDRDYKTYEEL